MSTATEPTVRHDGWAVEMPPGTYFLGDPCYAVPEDRWNELLDSCHFFGLDGEGSPVGRLDEHFVLGFSTRWGDGGYSDQNGWCYSVDAGLIGLTPAELCDRGSERGERLNRLGRFVTFDYPTECSTDGKGLLKFGGIIINTAD